LNKLGEPVGKRTSTSPPPAASLPLRFIRTAGGRATRSNVGGTHPAMEDNLLLFFTGYSRSASAILKDQNDRSKTMTRDA